MHARFVVSVTQVYDFRRTDSTYKFEFVVQNQKKQLEAIPGVPEFYISTIEAGRDRNLVCLTVLLLPVADFQKIIRPVLSYAFQQFFLFQLFQLFYQQ